VSLRDTVIAGVVLGAVYALSPLTVLSIAVLVLVLRWVARELTGPERDWFVILLTVAIVARFAAIAFLVFTADGSKPYTVFFGDEWIFKSRPLWLRNVGLGVPISTADFIYAFDETGMSGHMYVLAFLQLIVGDAPYGVHLFSVTVYVTAVALLFRTVRESFGPAPAFAGTAVLLFLPSLFAWSISVLKEPIYIALSIVELLMVFLLVRAPQWGRRILAGVLAIALAFAMEELRRGTLLVAGVGAAAGLAGWWTLTSTRRTLAAAIVVPAAIAVALMQPPIQARAMSLVHQSIKYHAGHIVTPGVSYQLVDPRIYLDWALIPQITPREAAQFVARAAVAYVVEPLPDHLQSRLLWTFLPEHFVWLLMIALVPVGVVGALRRDRGLAVLLLAHAGAIMMMVALASGNIGTLIRHRGLSLPYLVWFSAIGGLALVGAVKRRADTPRDAL
jgi:hypothetical protein